MLTTSSLGLIWPAIVLDLFGPFFVMTLNRVMQSAGVGAEKLKKAFEFYPATNIEHRIDRTGSFVTLVFGHTVLSLLYSSTAHIGVNAFLGKAILGLCQAFCLNTLYFEIDSFNLHTHAIRRHVLSTLAWMTLHLPMILTFVLAGAALAKMVVTDDVPGTHAYDLAYSSASHSEDHLSPGLRWFYTAGLGIGKSTAVALLAPGVYCLQFDRASKFRRSLGLLKNVVRCQKYNVLTLCG